MYNILEHSETYSFDNSLDSETWLPSASHVLHAKDINVQLVLE